MSAHPTEDAQRVLAARQASELDPALPDLPFADWLRGVLPPGATPVYEIGDCRTPSVDGTIGPAGGPSACLSVSANVVSRARRMELQFDRDGKVYRDGQVLSEQLEGTVRVDRLSGLDRALKKPLRAYPLVCPPGTQLKLKEEYAGLYEWCEDVQGRKHGPYRSWFSTGLYLMQAGAYEKDARTGIWIECTRFERCATRDYAASNP